MRTTFLLVAMAMLSACSVHEGRDAAFPETADDADPAVTFSLRGEHGAEVARVGAADILSADLNLGRYREDGGVALRGVAHGRPVNVDARGGEVAGLIGGQPVSLTVSREDGALVVSGLARGRMTSFRLDGGEVAGTIGGCSYELARAEAEAEEVSTTYEGRRSCGGDSEHVVLRMPASLSRWHDAESAAALAVLMGGA
jgi:hypothetical protein